MNQHQSKVLQFHQTFGITIADKPSLPSPSDKELRKNLILEEAREFVAAADKNDIVGVADALADLLYVVYGAAITYGLDMEPIYSEIHESNMSKLWDKEALNSKDDSFWNDHWCARANDDLAVVYRSSDGKVIKSPKYRPANLAPIIDALKS